MSHSLCSPLGPPRAPSPVRHCRVKAAAPEWELATAPDRPAAGKVKLVCRPGGGNTAGEGYCRAAGHSCQGPGTCRGQAPAPAHRAGQVGAPLVPFAPHMPIIKTVQDLHSQQGGVKV